MTGSDIPSDGIDIEETGEGDWAAVLHTASCERTADRVAQSNSARLSKP
jgi:hypothetical protein